MLIVPYLGAVIGDFPAEVRRISNAKDYSFASAEVLSSEEIGKGKYGQTLVTLRIGDSEVRVPGVDLSPIGALPFLSPFPKVGEKVEVYSDGQIVSGSTPALAALSILVKVALIAWIVFVTRCAFTSHSRTEVSS